MLFLILLAAFLYALHYGYKLAFQYTDPMESPYDYQDNDQARKVLGQDMGMPVKVVYPLIRLGGMLYGKFNLNADSPVEAVRRSTIPILLIHGDDDRFVPHFMSRNIHTSAPEKIEFHTIAGAGHALAYVTDPEGYTRIVNAFAKKCLNNPEVL